MKPIDFVGWLVVTGGVSLLNFIVEPALDLKLIGGSEEPLLRGVAPGMVVVPSFLAFMLSREGSAATVRGNVMTAIWISVITLIASLIIKSFIDQLALDQFWSRLLWLVRYLLLLAYFASLGTAIGAVWNVSKNP